MSMKCWICSRKNTQKNMPNCKKNLNKRLKKKNIWIVTSTKMEINKIHQGNALELLKQLPDNFIDMGITSPPYWRQRDYKSEPSIWNEKENCEHQWDFQERFLHRGTINTPTVHSALNRGGLETEWKTKDAFCLKCGAWLGQLGLEPSFEMYITNLCTIFNQVERVLKKEGSFWLNIGDTYGGSGGDSGKTGEFRTTKGVDKRPIDMSTQGNQQSTK